MRKALLTILQYIIFLGLGIGIVVYMSHQLSPEDKKEMINAIRHIHLWVIGPILVAGFFSHFFRALRWKLMLEPMDMRPNTVNTTFAVLIGYITNLVLPRAGEVAKCTVLARYEKLPTDKMIGSIVAERIFDVICLGIVTLSAVVLQANVIGNYAKSLLGGMKSKGYLLLVALAAVAVIILVVAFIYRRNKESKIGKFIQGVSHGVGSIIHMKKRWQFLVYTFLIWFMYLLQIQLGFWSLPATEHLGMLTVLVVLIFGSIGMITTQGGIGAYTYLVAHILLFYGIDKASGEAFGWVAWAVQTGIICLLGGISLILLPIYNRRRHAQISVDTEQDNDPGVPGASL